MKSNDVMFKFRLDHVIVNPPGIGQKPPSIVQDTRLYDAQAHVGRQGRNGGRAQVAINRMGRASLEVFQSTPLGVAATESGLAPARALFDHRQARFTQRLLGEETRAWRRT